MSGSCEFRSACGSAAHGAALNTLTLTKAGGVTTMTTLVQVPREIREGILASDMERGLQVSYNRLEDLMRG